MRVKTQGKQHIPTTPCTVDSSSPIYGFESDTKVRWASKGQIPAAVGEGGRISCCLRETVEIS